MRRLAMVGVWLTALVLAISMTWQIVDAADSQVSERPIAPLNVAAPVLADPQTDSTTLPESTDGSGQGATSTTSPSGSPSSTSSTTATGATTSTSASTAAWQTRSVQTVGGTVLLRYRPGEVEYQSATPAPGFQVEVEKQGPPVVKLEFESESHKVEVEAVWEGGDLKVGVSEKDED